MQAMLPPKTRSAGVDTDSSENPATIRICHIIDHLNLHGAQVYLGSLVRELSNRGYEQKVYGLNDPRHPKIVQMMSSAGARIETIGKARLLSTTGVFKLYFDLLKWRPHIVQTYLRFSDIIGRVLGKMARVPVNVSVVTQPNVDKYRWQYLLDNLTAGLSDRVVFNSEQIVPFALEKEGITPAQVVFIPNGIEREAPSRPGAGLAIRAQIGISPDARVIGSVARLYPQKGHTYLLSAFAKVLKACPDALLVLVGDGPLRGELEADADALNIRGRVKFLGERGDLADVLDAFDAYVQASLWEGMSIALMQAMLCEIPVVATRVDGTLEVIEDRTTGLLVEPGNSEALASGMIEVLQNREAAVQIAKNGAAIINENFSMTKMASRFDDLYRELLKSHDKGRHSNGQE